MLSSFLSCIVNRFKMTLPAKDLNLNFVVNAMKFLASDSQISVTIKLKVTHKLSDFQTMTYASDFDWTRGLFIYVQNMYQIKKIKWEVI